MSTTSLIRALDIATWVVAALSLVLLFSGLLDNLWATACLIATAAPAISSWVIKERLQGASKGDEPQ
ncbi:hypothetical protein [Paenarthrobacter nitroguajacolicus]|uniref:hypothetical protein n=1 Tax=Paenarthrobacter nitroguajacolicus TaxID=211146 RepID=UPI00285E528F|nr:hypothetical protein [Paenarthrobacter nitroguajacolicus]MDR6637410.1 hypothetical protein [Paenarthrobacter nitroguajacolicus]